MAHPEVLLVDSNADGIELYSTALALAGIEAATAGSAREALDQMKVAQPRVLVTGLRLPDTPATDLIRNVRRQARGRGIFIVALSTNERVEARQAREAGCDVVLKIPCLPETLVGELRRALS